MIVPEVNPEHLEVIESQKNVWEQREALSV